MRNEEHNIQATFVDWVLWTYKSDPTFIRPLFFSNLTGAFLGGGNRFANWEKLRRAGAHRGVWDFLYLQSRGDFSFLTIEFKTEKRRREEWGGLSEDQVEFMDAAKEAGAKTAICYSVEDAEEVFSEYMSLGIKSPAIVVLQSRGPGLKSEEPRP